MGLLASITPELAAVSLVILILFVASLLALAPLRRVRLPFTVAVMLAGFGLGVLLRYAHGQVPVDPAHAPDFLEELVHLFGGGRELSPDLILFVLLPPLVFESAFAMDARQLVKNLAPISVLAVPVLVLSTGITAGVLMAAGGADYGLNWPAALLFGALISATDPVAVVALFKDLGAPKRLGILVEGESLFNDGTAIVLFHILLALVVAPAGAETSLWGEVLGGFARFLVVAFGGAAVGWLLAWVLLNLIGSVTSSESVEISIMIVLAYASFVVAEHFLHVSGVLATVVAGLMAGSYGKTKVSPSVGEFMHQFWEYMAFAMNSLIFFLVGVVIAQIEADPVRERLPLFGAALVGVIAARAIGVFGSIPLLRRYVETITLRYQAVMFWGGLRGAVSLALALYVYGDEAVPLVVRTTIFVMAAGIVLFTLLVNALTMQPLIVSLGLDRPTLVDRFAQAYAQHERLAQADQVLKRLGGEGAVLPQVMRDLRARYEERCREAGEALASLRAEIESQPGAGEQVAARVALAAEKREVMRRFAGGELTEGATRLLLASADQLLDRLKSGLPLPESRTIAVSGPLESRLLSLLEPMPILGRLARRLRARHLAEDVEATRGLYLAATSVVGLLAEVEEGGAVAPDTLSSVRQRYTRWSYQAQDRLNQLSTEFPDYAASSQALLAELQVLRAESHTLHHLVEAGLLTDKALAEARTELLRRERELLRVRARGLELDPLSLLQAVPAFAGSTPAVLEALAELLVSRTFLEGETVVAEGEAGASMFLIARGCVRVSTTGKHGEEIPLSTLAAGSFFGEVAALLGGTRTATVRAMTPVNLLELPRHALAEVLADNPHLNAQVRAEIYPRVIGRGMAGLSALGSLSPAQRSDLTPRFLEETHPAGTTVVASGAAQRLTYVCEGTLRHGEEEHGEGSLIGAGAFAQAAHGAPLEAASEVRLLVLPTAVLTAFRAANPATADAIARACG